MRPPSFFWWCWLVAVTAGVIVFGLAMVLAPGLTQAFFNRLLFGSTAPPAAFGAPVVDYLVFVYGVLGAVMVGWGVALLVLVAGPVRRGDASGWWAVCASLAVWFVIDSTFSVASGHWPNAGLNLAFFVLYAVPLAATRPAPTSHG